MATPKQRYLGCVAVFSLGLIGVIGLVRHLWMDWVPLSVIARLSSADEEEVRRLLGEPTHRNSGDDYDKWAYRRSTRLAEFRIFFKSDGTVESWSYDR